MTSLTATFIRPPDLRLVWLLPNMAGFERPLKNIEVLVHHVWRLRIVKIVTENVDFADYQTKNAIHAKIITLSQPN